MDRNLAHVDAYADMSLEKNTICSLRSIAETVQQNRVEQTENRKLC